MVCVDVSMDRTAVPVGTGHMFKNQVIRHLVESIDEDGQVRARCGAKFKGAATTWQRDRPCQKCNPSTTWPPEDFTDRWEITIGSHREPQTHMPGGLEGLRAYCLQALEAATSKALSREVVRFLGYDPPELILVERPDLKEKITYRSAHMEAQYDRSRKFSKPSPF